jgi:hypothetical protein
VKIWTLQITDCDEPSVIVGKTEQAVLDTLREQWGVEDDVPDEELLQAVIVEYAVSIYGPDEHDLDAKPSASKAWEDGVRAGDRCKDPMCKCSEIPTN